jgi:hypothetical protein
MTKWAFRAGLAGSLIALVSCWPGSQAPRTNAPQPGLNPYVTYFLIDGLNQDVFEEELARGNLPHIARLVEDGVYIRNGIGAYPTMTGYAFYPFLTGVDAVRSGIYGLRWFDRGRDRGPFRHYVGKTAVNMNLDMRPDVKTMFEQFGDDHSMSVNSFMTRGVAKSTGKVWDFTMTKYRDDWWLAWFLAHIPVFGPKIVPTLEEVEAEVADLLIDDLEAAPKVQWVTFASPDAYAHVYGVDDRYRELVRNIDVQIGRYRDASRALGQEEGRIYLVLSDHGSETVTENIQMEDVLGGYGLRAWRGKAAPGALESSKIENEVSEWEDYDVLAIINGNLMNYLYVRNPEEAGRIWFERPTYEQLTNYPTQGGGRVDLVERLSREEFIELVVYRHPDGSTHIRTREGLGIVTKAGDTYGYRIEGRDPLQYGAPARRTAAQWLNTTAEAAYPYAVVRLHDLMWRENAGDILITASPTYDFGSDYEPFVGNYRGGHGGIRGKQLRVPYVISGPGICKDKQVPVATAEGLGATLNQLLGMTNPEQASPIPGALCPKGAATAGLPRADGAGTRRLVIEPASQQDRKDVG